MKKVKALGQKAMKRALDSAARGMKEGEGGPFGACLVKGNRILAVAHNTVLKSCDPTRHAEINAIRLACRRLGTFDLQGSEIYSTTEPCPMCFSAIHWARIKRIYWGTPIGAVHKRGFHELPISNATMKRFGKSRIQSISGFMKSECETLLLNWDKLDQKKVY